MSFSEISSMQRYVGANFFRKVQCLLLWSSNDSGCFFLLIWYRVMKSMLSSRYKHALYLFYGLQSIKFDFYGCIKSTPDTSPSGWWCASETQSNLLNDGQCEKKQRTYAKRSKKKKESAKIEHWSDSERALHDVFKEIKLKMNKCAGLNSKRKQIVFNAM